MKTLLQGAAIFTLLAIFNLQTTTAFAQGTAFSYQGRLNSGSSPASGTYDLTYSLYGTNVTGSVLAGPVTNSGVTVSNGLFTTLVNLGGQPDGKAYWIEIGVRTNGAGVFTTLAPRQQLLPTPYAMFANTASNLAGSISSAQLSGSITAAQLPAGVVTNNATGVNLSGAFSGNGSGLISLNATSLTSGTAPLAQLSGITSSQLDAATWSAATNRNGGNAALSTNVVAGISITNGFVTNSIFAGNGANLTNLTSANLVGVIPQSALPASVITNNAAGVNLTGTFSGNGSGMTNVNAASLSGNNATNFWQLDGNTVTTNQFIGSVNNQGLDFRVNNLRTFRIEPSGGLSGNIIGGNPNNLMLPGVVGGTIAGGGSTMMVGGSYGTIGGGVNSKIKDGANYSTIAGGMNNTISTNSLYGAIGGGANNIIGESISDALIAGGSGNANNASYSGIGGGVLNLIDDNAMESGIFGGRKNSIGVSARGAFIGGGGTNTISLGAYDSFIGGGSGNVISTNVDHSVIAGGQFNFIFDNSAKNFIGGGRFNILNKLTSYNVISGGDVNTIYDSADYCAVGGGASNEIGTNAQMATIPGGYQNFANSYSFAAGNQAKAYHTGSLVWADISSGSDFATTGNNQFLIRATGGMGVGVNDPAYVADFGGRIRVRNDANSAGVWFYNSAKATDGAFTGMAGDGSGLVGFWGNNGGGWGLVMNTTNRYIGLGSAANPANPLQMASGAYCSPAGVWTSVSDRNVKESFTPVVPQIVLAKVVALPVTQWKYKVEPEGTKHIGPVAQDFHAAFGLGDSERAIGTVDESGVALAAIQGLNQKLEEQKAENAELKAQRDALKVLVQKLAEKK